MREWETTMTPVMITHILTRTRRDGMQETITVHIGTPALIPDNDDMEAPTWYCPLQILGLTSESGDKVDTFLYGVGESAGEAFMHARTLPPGILYALPYADEIDAYILPNFGFPFLPHKSAPPFAHTSTRYGHGNHRSSASMHRERRNAYGAWGSGTCGMATTSSY